MSLTFNSAVVLHTVAEAFCSENSSSALLVHQQQRMSDGKKQQIY